MTDHAEDSDSDPRARDLDPEDRQPANPDLSDRCDHHPVGARTRSSVRSESIALAFARGQRSALDVALGGELSTPSLRKLLQSVEKRIQRIEEAQRGQARRRAQDE